MNTYRIEIEELCTGKRKVMPVPGCEWTEDSPGTYATRMCDCNLAGYFFNEVKQDKGIERTLPHNVVASNWLASNKCDHSMPPKRFKAIAAHIDGGRVVQL